MSRPRPSAAIILVGGLGTRLRPLTLSQPKALLPLLNKPFIFYQLDLLRRAGVKHVILAANPWFKKWNRAILRVAPRGIKLQMVFEPRPLGTGGAIRYAFDRLPARARTSPSPIWVFNGDVLMDIDLKAMVNFHLAHKAAGTIALHRVTDPSRFGLVRTDSRGRIQAFLEKPQRVRGSAWINAGVYVMNPSFIAAIPSRRTLSVEREVFPRCLREKAPLYAFRRDGYWTDIGTPATYLEVHHDLMIHPNRWTQREILCKGEPLSGGGRLIKGAHVLVSRRAELKGAVCLGPHVKVGPDVVLDNAVIMDRTVVETGVHATGVIVGRWCRVGAHSFLGPGTVLGDRTVLPPHTKT